MLPSPIPDVSVVLPVHDRFEFLEAAIASVLNQDWSGSIEIIVVHDGWDGDPRDVLPDVPENVQFVSQEHRGVGSARAHGIELARAPLIAFQDDDDLWLPHKLSIQCGVLERHPEVEMVFSDLVSFTPDGRRTRPYSSWWRDLRACEHTVVEASDPELLVFEPDALLFALTGDMRMFHQSTLYRRPFLDRIGGSDPRTQSCGDCLDMALRATHGGRIAYVDVPTFELRRGHGHHLTRDLDWARTEIHEVALVHEDYPEDLKQAIEPFVTRYLSGMAWIAYDTDDWPRAARLYDAAASHGHLSLRSQVKRLLARSRAHHAG